MKTVICVTGIALISALGLARAGDAQADALAARQGNWVCQGGGGQLGREGPARKLGLPFWNREFRPKITLTVKDDRWTMTHPDGTTKGKLVARKGAKLDEVDLTIDGKDAGKDAGKDVQLLGLIAPLAEDRWILHLNLPGKARPADTVSADLNYSWQAAK